jgi:hypothetical protein
MQVVDPVEDFVLLLHQEHQEGGGSGGGNGSTAGTAGTANTGGGGGAWWFNSPLPTGTYAAGANAGSGIVIVKELTKASGSWPLSAQFRSQKQGTWPKPSFSPVSFDYLVVAGGGGGGAQNGGGGGAGGYRTSFPGGTKITLSGYSGDNFPITVGGGGTAGTAGPLGVARGGNGNPSIFSTITAAGGGGGASSGPCTAEQEIQEDQVEEQHMFFQEQLALFQLPLMEIQQEILHQ